MQDCRDDPGGTVGWCGHDSTARGVFFIDCERVEVDPFDASKCIRGIAGAFGRTALPELFIEFGSATGYFESARQDGFGALDTGLDAILHDLPDVQQFCPD